ncbi:MAG: cytochrome P460 family protein, partial [Cyanobacteria bacterium]|nr:cytochrome P460 family protein [Cyanobacteriota bacterium]
HALVFYMRRKLFRGSQTFQEALVAAVVFTGTYSLLILPSHAERISSKEGVGNGPAANDSKFHKRLLEIAAEYESYGKVDDMARWAPWLCAMPAPPKARLSKSKDSGTHGKKLYYLFAKHRDSYMQTESGKEGQVIVKEAWLPPSADALSAADAESKNPFKPDILGPKSGLYIMFKTDPKAADTDEGWVYGTVTADGKTITSAGRVESCMSCHLSAPHGRLFGLQEHR